MKVPNPPGSGKDIAEGNGVHREVESKGSWMWITRYARWCERTAVSHRLLLDCRYKIKIQIYVKLEINGFKFENNIYLIAFHLTVIMVIL